MKKVLFTLTAFLIAFLFSTQTSFAQCTPQGNPGVFGDDVWNVYAWNAGDAADIGNSWNTNYSGYYVETSLSFSTTSRWSADGAPSDASGYLGCAVGIDNHSFSAKRAGFTCGYYKIDITSHDDEAELYVDGAPVWEHVACCDAHGAVWTGWLAESSTIEFRVTEGGGGSHGALTIDPVNFLNTTAYAFNCKVSEITLSTSVPSPVWSTGATSSSININAAGTYSVTFDGGFGCTASSSVEIASSSNPTASITGPACQYTGNMLSGSVTGTISSVRWKLDGNYVSSSLPVWGSHTVVAGNNGAGTGSNQLYNPVDVAIDAQGTMYIANNNGRIMKWEAGASSGTVVASGLNNPAVIFLDKQNNLYVCESGNARVLKYTPGSSTPAVVAGGNGSGSNANQLTQARGLFVDDAGNIYVNDGTNARIQKWAPGATSGVTVAGGNGQGSGNNQWNNGYGVWVDGSGNMYICDPVNFRVLKWATGATSGTVVAGGNGQGNGANQLYFPTDIWMDETGNMIIKDNNRLVAWRDGQSSGSLITTTFFPELGSITGFGVAPNGSLYLTSDYASDVVRFDVTTLPVTNFSPAAGGTYEMMVADFNGCTASATYELGATPTINNQLNGLVCGGGAVTLTASGASGYTWNPGNLAGAEQTVSPASTTTYTLSASNGCSTTATVDVNNLVTGSPCVGGTYLVSSEVQPALLVWNVNGSPVKTTIAKWDDPGSYVVQNNTTLNPGYAETLGLAMDDQGNIYVCDPYNHRVMKWAPGATEGIVVAGGSQGSGPTQLSYPQGIFIDRDNNLYVCDASNARVQKFSYGSNMGVTVAGGNFAGSNNNQLRDPSAVYLDDDQNIFICDANNHRVMKWAAGATSGVVVAGGNGQGYAANQLAYPNGVVVDAAGNVYVVEANNNRVQKWAPGASEGIMVAGTGGYGDGLQSLKSPSGLGMDAAGNLYISNFGSAGIRVWTPGATIGEEPIKLPAPLDGSSNLLIAKNGDIYVAGYPAYPYNNYFVLKYTVNGFQSYAPPSTGEFSVTVTSFNGCSVSSAVSTVQPSPYIVEGPSVNACTATGVTLTAAGTQNYVWTPGNLTGAEQTFMPSVNTVYTVTDDHNCTATTLATLYTSPGVSITGNACVNSTLTAAITGDPAAIQWQLNGVTKKSDAPGWNINATTVAGGNGNGSAANQLGSSLYLGIFKDDQGNLYISDGINHRVQKWAPGATSGTTVATGTVSNQLYPQGLFVDDQGNLYVADAGLHCIQKFAPGSSTGIIVAGGNGAGGGLNQFQNPSVVSVDHAGNIYVLDGWSNARVMKWAPGATEGVVVAGGNGQGSGNNQIYGGNGMVVDEDGTIYVNEWYPHRVQKWMPGATAGITIITGLYNAEGLFKDAAGYFYTVNHLVISQDYASQIVRFREGVNYWTNILPTLYGSGPDQIAYSSNGFIDANGDMYVLDGLNYRVQKFTHSVMTGSSFVPEAPGDYTAVALSYAGCNVTSNIISVGQTPVITSPYVNICEGGNATLSVSNSGNFSWNPGSMSGSSVNVSPGSTTVYTITDDGNNCSSVATVKVNAPVTAALTGPDCIGTGNLITTLGTGNPFKMEWKRNGIPVSTITASYSSSTATTVAGGNGNGSALNGLGNPTGACFDNDGNLYVAELTNHRVTKWAPGASSGVIVAGGNGIGNAPDQVPYPYEVFVDNHGNLYVAESYNYRVLKFAPGSTMGVTVAGGNGLGSALNQLTSPNGLWVDDAGNVYVSDAGNSRVTKWAPGTTSGVIVAGGNGSGNAANQLNGPTDIKMDTAGNLYIAENSGYRVTKWAPGATSGTTIAGDGTYGYGPVQINNPRGIDFDGAGNLYVLNAAYNMVWRWAPGATQGVYMAGFCCSGQGSLKNVSGICVGEDGSLYVVDQTNYSVQKYPVNPPSTSYTPPSAGDYTVETTSFANCTAVSNTVTVYDAPVIPLTGNQYFCDGATTTLDAGTHQQYNWSTGGTSQTETFSTAGSYSVTATDNGCATTENFSIAAQSPVINLSASPNTTCIGNPSQLSVSPSGGGSINSYLWSPGGSTISNPVVNPETTTTYTLTATSLTCSTTATVTVTVAPAPGDTSVYGDHVWNVYAYNVGGAVDTGQAWNQAYSGYYVESNLSFDTYNKWSYYLSPSNASGYVGCPVSNDNHSWSAKRKGFDCGIYEIGIGQHDDAAQLFVNGVMVWEHTDCCDAHPNVWTGVLDNNSTVNFRVTDGGGLSQGIITIIPKSIMTVNGPTTICPGFSVVLNGGTADSYLWSTGETTQTISVSDSGTYSVDVTISGCTKTISQQIIVAPLDTPAIFSYTGLNYCPVNNGVDLNIDDNERYQSVLWSTGEPYANISVDQAGDYSVTVSDALGCSATSHVTVIGPPGDPAAFGDGVWNVYAYFEGTYGGGYYGSYAWLPYDYSGYYIDSTFSFSTEHKWSTNSNPSTAPGYQGCTVNNDFHSWSAKRQGFDCGFYQIDVTNHDDDAELYIDDILVWQHQGCCDNHTNIWSGALNASSRIEFRGADNTGGSTGVINIIPLTGNAPFISVSGHPVVCTGQSYNLTSSLTGASYVWSTGETTSSIEVGASGSFFVSVTDNTGCTLTSDPVSINILPDAAPVAHITASSTVVCDGNPVTLTSDSTSGNNWSTFESTQSIAATKWTYYLKVVNNAGCYDSDTIYLTQRSAPAAPLAGNAGACEGSGAVLTATGLAPGGQVASFNGINEYISVTQNIPESNYTIEMWVKTTSANTGIFSVTDGSVGSGTHDRDLYLQNGQLWVYVSATNPFNSGVTINDGEWHHISFRQSSSSVGGFGLRVYVDGVQTPLITTKSTSTFTSQTAFVIGHSSQAQQKFFDGEIDNVRIWNVPRSVTDIHNNMSLETPLSSTNLVYQSALNGTANAVTGNNGTAPNGISWAVPDFYTYTWTGDGAPAPSTSETQTTSALTTGGNYSVTASSGICGNSASATTIVTVAPVNTYYTDADNDGYGDAFSTVLACAPGAGYIDNNTDCNDAVAAIHPGASDVCNGIDDDCNTLVDENAIVATIVTPIDDVTVCKGTLVTFTANSGSGISYQWMKNSIDIVGATNQTYSGKKAASYQVKETNVVGCTSTSEAVAIIAQKLPVAVITALGDLDICITNSVTLQANSGNQLTYQWKKGSELLAGATNQTYTTNKKGNYHCIVTNKYGCPKKSNGLIVTRDCGFRDDAAAAVNLADLSLYPNPTTGRCIVDFKSSEGDDSECKVMVMNIVGQIVYAADASMINGELQHEIILSSGTAAGMYMVRVVMNDDFYERKLIVQY